MQLPNHTQLSNDFIDNWMGQLNGSSVKVFLAIARKTIGWHKEIDKISLTQLEKLTGSARQTILNAIGRLEDKGLVTVNRSGNINEFEINYDSLNTRPVQKLDQQQSNNKTSDSLKIRHTKETNTKETINNIYNGEFKRNDEFSDDANDIIEFIFDESPELAEWDKPLTFEQAEKLINKYEFNKSHIESKLLDMPDFDYKSVYRTALKWLKKDRQKGWDQNYEQQHSQAAAYEAFD